MQREKLRSLPSMLYISPNARVTERFTRTGPGEILYGFTVEDPATFSRPWTAELVLRPLSGQTADHPDTDDCDRRDDWARESRVQERPPSSNDADAPV